MTGTNVIAIAKKEFFDQLISRKFLLVLGILLIIAVIGILNGISDYDTSLANYNDLQQSVSQTGGILSPAGLNMEEKPSVLLVFYQMSTLFMVIGGILGIAMGFDLVTKEKESRSLKILLAHPVYRDQVINGKALGGIGAIFLALVCTMAVSLAVLFLFGIVPEPSELLPILFFCAATFLLIFSFFAIALLMSTLCEESGRSLVYTLIVFIVLGSFVPAVITSPLVMDLAIGPAPDMPKIATSSTENPENPANQAAEAEQVQKQNFEAWEEYSRLSQEYVAKQIQWADMQYLFSPINNYGKITTFLTNPDAMSEMLYGTTGMMSGGINTEQDISVSVMSRKIVDPDFSGILAMLAGNIVALLVLPGIFFGLSYVSFMRMDIR